VRIIIEITWNLYCNWIWYICIDSIYLR